MTIIKTIVNHWCCKCACCEHINITIVYIKTIYVIRFHINLYNILRHKLLFSNSLYLPSHCKYYDVCRRGSEYGTL